MSVRDNANPCHKFTDVSRHGSSTYVCNVCGIGDWEQLAAASCEAVKRFKIEDEKRSQEIRDRHDQAKWDEVHAARRELISKYLST